MSERRSADWREMNPAVRALVVLTVVLLVLVAVLLIGLAAWGCVAVWGQVIGR